MVLTPTETIMLSYKNNFCRGHFMFGYDHKFTDIQKQIAVADSTDEQILELVNALQTKRS